MPHDTQKSSISAASGHIADAGKMVADPNRSNSTGLKLSSKSVLDRPVDEVMQEHNMKTRVPVEQLLRRKRVETLLLKAIDEWESGEPHQIVRHYSEEIMAAADGR